MIPSCAKTRPRADLRKTNLLVSNSLSGGDWELDEVLAMGDPAHVVQIDRDRRVPAGEGQRRVALQRRVAACRIVVNLELCKLAFQITGIPERHMIEKFSRIVPIKRSTNGCDTGTCGTVLTSSISRIRRFAFHRCVSKSGS